MEQLLLNQNWQMYKTGSNKRYDTNIPSTMYQVLLSHGEIEDPFFGENDRVYRQLSDDNYTFETTFHVEATYLKYDRLIMVFEGVDTLSNIYLNGKKIASTDNMHRTYRLDVAHELKVGTNKLEICLASPTKYIAAKQENDPLWGVSSTMDGYEHIRKAHCMFGWDWGPQLPDMGIWRDVRLCAYNKGEIKDFYVTQDHQSSGVGLNVQIDCDVWDDEPLTLKISLKDAQGNLVSEAEGLASATSKMHLVVPEPNLWWPNGYGDAYLYTLEMILADAVDTYDQVTKSIGLRTLTMRRRPDAYGETFNLEINGVEIFAMGANYIPEDALITRPKEVDTKRLIEDCVLANYNCIRVWGGGVYPSDYFYDLCDRNGLIVWQDFMFACGVYRLTKAFEANITAEIIDNVKRLRHHASLGLWCGNNEMEVAFVEWGLPKDERLRLDYLLMYEKLIPDLLEEHDPGTFYWPASPSSGGGFVDPNADNKGDVHYWSVFHGNEHYKKFRDHYFRFASEYGMQAFPDKKTINTFCPKDQQQIHGPIMENHNKCTDPINGNLKIIMNTAFEFLIPENFEDTVYVSQVSQGETIKCAVEHFRRNRGRCMGSTYWQFNDNFPGASWASVDYFGRWKALHYFARRFHAPILISAYESGTKGHIHVTNDSLKVFSGTVKWQIRHVDGRILEAGHTQVCVESLSPAHITTVDIAPYCKRYGEERKCYLAYQLYDVSDHLMSSETLLFTYHKYFEFEPVQIQLQVNKDTEGEKILVTSDGYAKSVGLTFESLDVVLSDNYFDLLPGETRQLSILRMDNKWSGKLSDLKADIQVQVINKLDEATARQMLTEMLTKTKDYLPKGLI